MYIQIKTAFDFGEMPEVRLFKESISSIKSFIMISVKIAIIIINYRSLQVNVIFIAHGLNRRL